ncbi:MAG: transglycosylase domain-containing protein, partial [Verrucomicrobiales bacterium]|nr:transglycosylase domain-containing protein [Verrucomicrobiales bacterium]
MSQPAPPPHSPAPSALRRWIRRLALLTGALALAWWIAPWLVPLPAALKVPRPTSARYVARDGSPLRQMLDETGQRSSPWTPLAEIPQGLIQATIAVEDQRFWHHGGMDWRALTRAVRDNFQAGRVVSGASTIAQQLAKTAAGADRPRNLTSKILESLQARRLVREWGHSRVLEEYLNRISYGNLMTGCTAAAEGLFHKPLHDLTPAECALLAGLPQGPTRLNPFHHPAAAQTRQRHVLERMREEGWITEEAYTLALTQPLVYQRFHGGFAAPHGVALAEQQPLDSPSGIIRTTLDAHLQDAVEGVIHNELARLAAREVGHAAAVVIENATGDVLALVGSRDFHALDGGQINGAWVPHSPGSALKPFTYLLALEAGWTGASIIPDLPISFVTDTGVYRPENYDGRCYGPVTLRTALGSSLNISAVRTLDALGGAAVLQENLQTLGLTTLTEPATHYGLGLTLGNAPVRLVELTSAYATLARRGQMLPWRLLLDAPRAAPRRLFSAETSWIIADILRDNQARLLTFGAHSPLHLPFPAAFKTGTSSSYRDNWTLAFTAEFTVGVWAGNFDRHPMQGVSGVTGAAPIAAAVLRLLHRERGTTWIQRPASLQKHRIDPRTGHLLPPELAPRATLSRSEWFQPEHLPDLAQPSDYDDTGRAWLPPEYAAWSRSPDNWLGGSIVVR